MSAKPRPYDDTPSVSPTGTVNSVGLAMPVDFTVTNSPVTSSGVLNAAWNSQAANMVLASPAGAAGTPTFRLLANADIPPPTLAARGGVRAINQIAHQYLTWLSTAGLFAQAQPAFGDLSDYAVSTAFSPTITFATAGNLTVSYASQTGFWIKLGAASFFTLYLVFTPTYTTSAGNFIINLAPVPASGANLFGPVYNAQGVAYPSGTTSLTYSNMGGSQLSINANGNGTGVTLTTAHIVSGIQTTIGITGTIF